MLLLVDVFENFRKRCLDIYEVDAVKLISAKANNKYMKGYDVNSWAMSQKLPAFNFEWVEDTSQFKDVFIKNYIERSEVGYILEFDVQYPQKLYERDNDLPFLTERRKLGKLEQLVTSL